MGVVLQNFLTRKYSLEISQKQSTTIHKEVFYTLSHIENNQSHCFLGSPSLGQPIFVYQTEKMELSKCHQDIDDFIQQTESKGKYFPNSALIPRLNASDYILP